MHDVGLYSEEDDSWEGFVAHRADVANFVPLVEVLVGWVVIGAGQPELDVDWDVLDWKFYSAFCVAKGIVVEGAAVAGDDDWQR